MPALVVLVPVQPVDKSVEVPNLLGAQHQPQAQAEAQAEPQAEAQTEPPTNSSKDDMFLPMYSVAMCAAMLTILVKLYSDTQ